MPPGRRTVRRKTSLKIAFYTLGCRTNQFETQAMEKLFAGRGHTLAPWGPGADVYVVNSCTVTAVADQKTRQILHRVRRENPDALVALCGCMAQNAGEDAAAALGVDVLGGNRDHAAFVDAVCRAAAGEGCPADTGREAEGFVRLPAGGLAERTRALLKIEDGCDSFCAYCAIPYARGRVRSLPPEELAAEARRLAAAGFGEIVVTGIEISAYGRDLGLDGGLTAAAGLLCDAAAPARVSLGSLRPTAVTEAFCRTLSRKENFCRHFHLSLQSGSDGVLGRMRRDYGADGIRRGVALLREWFDDPNITGDVICGFCGETEAEFEETLALAEELELGGLHVFPYSERAGTYAARRLADDVKKAEKERRCAALSAVSRRNHAVYLARQVGKSFTVVFEHRKPSGVIGGYTENYLFAVTEAPDVSAGDVRRVTAVASDGEELTCRPAE